MIFDEVITGFRLGRGGAAERFGVTPDISCFGKVIGGGLPIGAVGARAEIMATLAPLGPVYQAGTLSGNPLATAAGLAVLEHLTPKFYRDLEEAAAATAAHLRTTLAESGFDALVIQEGTLLGLYMGTPPAEDPIWRPKNYDDARTTDEQAYARLHAHLLSQGTALAPGAYETLFVTPDHVTQLR